MKIDPLAKDRQQALESRSYGVPWCHFNSWNSAVSRENWCIKTIISSFKSSKMRLRAQMGPLLHLNAAKTLNLMVLKSLQLRCSARGGLLKKMSHNGDGSNLARFVTNPRGATITWTLGPKIESLPPPPPPAVHTSSVRYLSPPWRDVTFDFSWSWNWFISVHCILYWRNWLAWGNLFLCLFHWLNYAFLILFHQTIWQYIFLNVCRCTKIREFSSRYR